MLLVTDLLGTALFAAEGAAAGTAARLDLLGVLVLGFVTAVGGGILRDLLIGATPPSAIRDWRYPAISLVTAAGMFLLHPPVAEYALWLTPLDAAALSLFAVAGATKALEFGIHPLVAVLMGGITGVGGGTVRDLLTLQVPVVLRADVYASAALLGGLVSVVALRLGVRAAWASAAGATACFGLRMLAVRFHWHLPGGVS